MKKILPKHLHFKSLGPLLIILWLLVIFPFYIFFTHHPNILLYPESSNLYNLEDFSYLQNNPSICSADSKYPYKSLLLVLVHSARSNLEKRHAIRSTLAIIKSYHGWDIRFVFLLGKPDPFILEPFKLEDSDDLIIGDFVDTYRNLTYKHLMGYRWASEHCPRAEYILKMDDDVFFDHETVFENIKMLQVMEPNGPGLACSQMDGSPPIRTESKWRVTLEEWPQPNYPIYCSGMGYLIKREALLKIYSISQSVPFFWIDDVYVTGVLREKAGVSILPLNKYYKYLVGNEGGSVIRNWTRNWDDIGRFPWGYILHFGLDSKIKYEIMAKRILDSLQDEEAHRMSITIT